MAIINIFELLIIEELVCILDFLEVVRVVIHELIVNRGFHLGLLHLGSLSFSAKLELSFDQGRLQSFNPKRCLGSNTINSRSILNFQVPILYFHRVLLLAEILLELLQRHPKLVLILVELLLCIIGFISPLSEEIPQCNARILALLFLARIDQILFNLV